MEKSSHDRIHKDSSLFGGGKGFEQVDIPITGFEMAGINIKDIADRAKTTYYADQSFINSNFNRIKKVYGETSHHATRVRKNIRRRPRGIFKKISSDFVSRVHHSWEFIEASSTVELSSLFLSMAPNDIRSFFRNELVLPKRADFEVSDKESIERMCKGTGSVGRNTQRLLTRASSKSLFSMGISIASGNGKIKKISESVNFMSKPTNSGFPSFSKKNSDTVMKDTKNYLRSLFLTPDKRPENKKGKYYVNPRRIDKFYKRNFSIIFNSAVGLTYFPTVLFHRIQVAMKGEMIDQLLKIRQVWCVPYPIVCLERMFFGEWLDRASAYAKSSNKPVYTIGLSSLEIGQKIISRLHLEYALSGKRGKHDSRYVASIYSLDFSKFDQTIPTYFFDLLYSHRFFQLSMTTHEKIVFDMLRLYSKYTPLVFGGCVYLTTHGVCSGLYLTNFYDTFVNSCIICAVSILISIRRKHSSIDKFFKGYTNFECNSMKSVDFFVNNISPPSHSLTGDDALILCTFGFIRRHKCFCDHLGMKVDIKNIFTGDKTRPSYTDGSYIFYLGRYWDKYGNSYQPDNYFWAHLIVRTKFYDLDLIGVQNVEELELYRALSICLQHKNGLSFLDRNFSNWEIYSKWRNFELKFKFIGSWPNDNYPSVDHQTALAFYKFVKVG